jgi:hypothetical protein
MRLGSQAVAEQMPVRAEIPEELDKAVRRG